MIETVLIVFIIAHFKKLDIRKALRDWSILLVIGTVIFYIIFQIMIFTNNYSLVKYTYWIKTVTFVCYYIMAYKHKLYKEILIACCFVLMGSGLNSLVMSLNNGKMPIFPSLTYATGYTNLDIVGINGDLHTLGNQNTNIIWLADIFDWGYCIASIGDILVRIGMGFLLYKSIILNNNT